MYQTNICRICLSFNLPLLPLFEKKDVKEKIMECASVEMNENDGLPSAICQNCLIKLNDAYSFRLQIIQSDKELKRNAFYKNEIQDIKEEYKDEESIFANNLCEAVFMESDRIKQEENNSTDREKVDKVNTETNDLYKEKNTFNKREKKSNSKKTKQEQKQLKSKRMHKTKTSKKRQQTKPKNDTDTDNEYYNSVIADKNEDECSERKKKSKRRYLCSTCGKSVTNYRHFKIHESKRPFVCDQCGKNFKTKPELKGHRIIHTGHRPHVCDICNKTFRHKAVLRNHVKIHLGVKAFGCTVCEKAFVRKAALEKHMRCHTGEKPFACEFCQQRFSGKWNLTQHLRRHTDKKPYVCHYCPLAFRYNVTLKQHIRSKHTSVITDQQSLID